MPQHVFKYYSTTFEEIETPLQNHEVNDFKRSLLEKLTELPSDPFFFRIKDFIKSIRRLKPRHQVVMRKSPIN